MNQDLFPAFLDLKGVSTLVVGGGQVALRKVKSLLSAGAQVQVVSPRVVPELRTLANQQHIQLWLIYFNPKVFQGQRLVFACTNDPEVNRKVAEEAQKVGAWVNVADASAPSSLVVPSSMNREGIRLAISTGLPALSAKLRRELEDGLPFGYDRLVNFLLQARERLKTEVPQQERRSEVLNHFLAGLSTQELIRLSDEELENRLQQCLSSSTA